MNRKQAYTQANERYDRVMRGVRQDICAHCGGTFPVYLERDKRREGLMGIYVAQKPFLLCPGHLAEWDKLLERQDDERRAFVKGGGE